MFSRTYYCIGTLLTNCNFVFVLCLLSPKTLANGICLKDKLFRVWSHTYTKYLLQCYLLVTWSSTKIVITLFRDRPNWRCLYARGYYLISSILLLRRVYVCVCVCVCVYVKSFPLWSVKILLIFTIYYVTQYSNKFNYLIVLNDFINLKYVLKVCATQMPLKWVNVNSSISTVVLINIINCILK